MKSKSQLLIQSLALLLFLAASIAVFSDTERLFADLKFYSKCYRFMDSTLMAYCYEKLGLLFVVIEKSTGYFPLENLGDDLGIYYFFGMYSYWFKQIMGNTQGAYLALNISGLVFFWCVNVFFIRKLSSSVLVHRMSVLLISLFVFLCLFILDVYIWNVIIVSMIFPAVFAFQKLKGNSEVESGKMILLTICSGILLGIANHIRTNQSYGFMILLAGFLFFDISLRRRNKLILISTLVISTWLSHLLIQKYFENRMAFRNSMLLEKYNYNIQSVRNGNSGHVIWHSLVLGVGFDIFNPKKIQWRDNFGFELYNNEIKKQEKTNITKVSVSYESFMKDYYLAIWKDFPGYMLLHYLKKAGYCLSFLILILNVSLLRALQHVFNPGLNPLKKKSFIQLSFFFLICIALGWLGGFLVYPMPAYGLAGIYPSILLALWILHQTDTSNPSPQTSE